MCYWYKVVIVTIDLHNCGLGYSTLSQYFPAK